MPNYKEPKIEYTEKSPSDRTPIVLGLVLFVMVLLFAARPDVLMQLAPEAARARPHVPALAGRVLAVQVEIRKHHPADVGIGLEELSPLVRLRGRYSSRLPRVDPTIKHIGR